MKLSCFVSKRADRLGIVCYFDRSRDNQFQCSLFLLHVLCRYVIFSTIFRIHVPLKYFIQNSALLESKSIDVHVSNVQAIHSQEGKVKIQTKKILRDLLLVSSLGHCQCKLRQPFASGLHAFLASL